MNFFSKEDLSSLTIICPQNDGEAKTIVEISQRLGIDVRVSQQPWGARLDLEPEENLQNLKPIIIVVEMPSPEKEYELRMRGHIVVIIDHHTYISIGLDRTNNLSSLEQFAKWVGYDLSRWEMGIAINDRGYIFGLIEAGYTEDEILQIRQFDLEAQGATIADFHRCIQALEKGAICNGTMVINLENANPSYAVDLHTMKNPDTVRDILICRNADIRFFGSPEKAKALSALGGWFGGGEKSKFWGSETANIQEVYKILGID